MVHSSDSPIQQPQGTCPDCRVSAGSAHLPPCRELVLAAVRHWGAFPSPEAWAAVVSEVSALWGAYLGVEEEDEDREF